MMESRRNSSDSPIHDQFKKIKATHQIDSASDEIILNLPAEIIIEILTRLPVKSLVKFRCVSKSWSSLISSKQFIEAHLKNSTNNTIFSFHKIIFTVSHPHFKLQQCHVHSMMYEQLTYASDIDYPESNQYRSVWVVGSCNGLICIAIEEKELFLWNPATRISKKLPLVDVEMKVGFYNIYGFGYNECDGDYKVVGIFCVFGNAGEYESIVKIYSLKTNSWKRIEDFKGGIPLDDSGKFASGKLHFSATPLNRWNIVSLDLVSETYGTVEQPNYGDGCFDTSLGVLGGCISVLCNHRKTRADVWVLKDYCIKESWTKVICIPYLDDHPGRFSCSNPLCMLPSGETLLIFGWYFAVYNPRDNSFRIPRTRNIGVFEADVYVESLVSP